MGKKPTWNKPWLSRSVLALAGILGLLMSGFSAEDEDRYVFSNFEVGSVQYVNDQPHLEVEYATAWSGQAFPGWRSCTITARDGGGASLGERIYEVVDLSSAPSVKSTLIPLKNRSDAAKVEKVTAECSSERLDDAQGRYSFSDVNFTRNDEVSKDLRSFDVSFDASWSGDAGLAGIARCTLVGRDSEGVTLFSYDFNFGNMSPERVSNLEMLILTDVPQPETPSSGEIGCSEIK